MALNWTLSGAEELKILHDAEGEPLPEDILVPYLAGLNRSDFEEMFGLDHLRLREGGQRLLEAGGEFSQSLFEAASGMRYLTEEMESWRLPLWNSTAPRQGTPSQPAGR